MFVRCGWEASFYAEGREPRVRLVMQNIDSAEEGYNFVGELLGRALRFFGKGSQIEVPYLLWLL